MSNIFHEVEDDLRRERMGQLWARYGTFVIILAVAIVAGTAGTVYWKQNRQKAHEAQAEALSAASETVAGGDPTHAMQQFGDLAAGGGAGYAMLALFRQAGILTLSGDVQGALAIYDKIAQSDADDRLKAIARLRAANAVEETEAPDTLKARVADLAKEDSPWRYEARSILAYADFRSGKLDDAAKAYAALAADQAAPQSLRDRAKQLAGYLNGGAVPASAATQLSAAPAAAPPAEAAPGKPAGPPATPAPATAEPNAPPKPTATTGSDKAKPPAGKPKPH